MKMLKKSDKPYLFEDGLLPAGFVLPESYLHLLNGDLPDIKPWWWLALYKELCISWARILKKQFPQRTLIPFAKDDRSDDVVCFDGTDTSGDPKVLFIHTFCSPGWEDKGAMKSFDEWLKLTLEKSKQFKLELEQDLQKVE